MRFHLGWIEGSVPKIFANFQGYKWDGSGTGVGRKWDGSGTEEGRKWDGCGRKWASFKLPNAEHQLKHQQNTSNIF